MVFGAGGYYCDYPPEPSGQHGHCGSAGLAGYGSGYSWRWVKLYDFPSILT